MSKISIITASYNYANYISETIESVINQTYTDWELLVIDDGSTDNSIEVINSYVKKDTRVKLLTHPNNENRGLIATLQLGIKEAKGEYITFLESDDYIAHNYLDKKINMFNRYNDVAFIYNDVETIGSLPHKKLQNKLKLIRNFWSKNNYPQNISEYLTLENYIPTFSCVMLKKDLFNDINWDTKIPAIIDWWLWIQISQKTKTYYINEKLTFWRMHEDSYINKTKTQPQKSYDFLKDTYKIIPQIANKKILTMFIIKKILRIIKYNYLIFKDKIIR